MRILWRRLHSDRSTFQVRPDVTVTSTLGRMFGVFMVRQTHGVKWREIRGGDLSVNFTPKSTQLTQSHAKIKEVRLQPPVKVKSSVGRTHKLVRLG